jgi:hypothetical protein
MKSSAAIGKLWEYGIIGPWYLRKNQLDAYALFKSSRYPFFEATRRFGKTTTGLCHVQEDARRNHDQPRIWRWCEPWKNQAREIVIPEMEVIQRTCPERLKFKYYKTDSLFVGPNGAMIYLRGVNEDRGESARGAKAHGLVADEVGSWNDPDYIRNEVLRPQLLTTQGQLVDMGTPPEDLGHPFYKYKADAIRQSRFVQKTIHQSDMVTPEQILEICEQMGGPDSPAWRREFLCEPVSSPEKLVIPEFREELHVVDDDYPLPSHFDAYVGADLGFNDNTALVFAHLDFLTNTLVVEEELVVSGKNSREITDAAKAIEKRLWPGKLPYKRVSDNEVQQLYDMATMCDYPMVPTRKDEKLAAINALRLRFTRRTIKIKRRCKSLQYQLKVGLWNDKRTDYLRGDETGHLDAIDALVYLNRNLNEHHNPYPADSYSTERHYVPKGLLDKPLTPDLESLKNALTFPLAKRLL